MKIFLENQWIFDCNYMQTFLSWQLYVNPSKTSNSQFSQEFILPSVSLFLALFLYIKKKWHLVQFKLEKNPKWVECESDVNQTLIKFVLFIGMSGNIFQPVYNSRMQQTSWLKCTSFCSLAHSLYRENEVTVNWIINNATDVLMEIDFNLTMAASTKLDDFVI